MNTTQQPEALRLADALAYCDSSVASQATAELRSLHAEITALQSGYAAARLEIESLRASPSGIQWQCGPQANGFTAPAGDYPPLPAPGGVHDHGVVPRAGFTANQMRDYVDADRAARAQAAQAAAVDRADAVNLARNLLDRPGLSCAVTESGWRKLAEAVMAMDAALSAAPAA